MVGQSRIDPISNLVHQDTKLIVVQQGHGLCHVEGILQLFLWCHQQGTNAAASAAAVQVWLWGRGLRRVVHHLVRRRHFLVVVAATGELQLVLQGTPIHEFAQHSQTAISVQVHQERMRSRGGVNNAILTKKEAMIRHG